jgi:hypothetical protein
MLSYTIKRLRIDVTLGEGTFDGTNNTKSFSGLEMSVNIEKPGAPDKNKAKVTITGMALDDMRQMTMLAFKPLQRQKNLIAIYAGDDQSGMNMCFAGEITTASADFSGAPTIKMNIEAAAGAYPALKASSPVAVSGSQTAAELVEMFAKEAGYAFENKGVTASVKNAVFNGDPITKAQSVARQVGAELIIDDNTFVLLPWDKGRNGDNAVKMSPDAGMVGYPSFGADGISLKCFYNPALELGGLVEVTSVVPGASGTWKITKLTHKLVANSLNAADWFSELEASPIGYEKKKA